MREFEDKINPFLVPVRFSGGSSEQSICTGKSLVENGDEIVFEHKLINLAKSKGFAKDEIIALCILSRESNSVEEMIEFINKNPDADFYELLKKSVDLYKQNNQ